MLMQTDADQQSLTGVRRCHADRTRQPTRERPRCRPTSATAPMSRVITVRARSGPPTVCAYLSEIYGDTDNPISAAAISMRTASTWRDPRVTRVPARRSLAHHIRRIFANIRAEYSANLREDCLPEVLLLLRARAVVATREAMRLAPKLVNLRASKYGA